ncbi:MAG TPA: cytochrome P450 [Candidatus Binatia bacterium]|nr:cytochrome P450 [Candidatus Binatia bacterium]
MQPHSVLTVDEIQLGDPVFWKRPPEEREGAFATLRRERPVSFHAELDPRLPSGPGFWALSRHADVLKAGTTPKVFSSARGIGMIDLPPEFLEFFGSMIAMDHPRHGRLRRLVSAAFTARQLAKVETDVQHAAACVIDAVAEKGSCDFVTEIAAPFPIRIICEMMGIPESQHAFVFEQTNIILGAGDPEYVAEGTDVMAAFFNAGAALAELMKDLARLRQATPAEDLTSVLVNAEIAGDRLNTQELASFFVLLVAAGNETTRNAISHGMKALSDHPDERGIWQRDFDRVAPTAVEEIVRWASPVIFMRRSAVCDTEIGGQKIREGDKVLLFYSSANRDEAVFADPFRFDVRRDPNDHLGFGGGPHFCLGANLARREITVMFQQLFRRLPDLEITGPADLLWSPFIHGIKHMPCRFTPRAAELDRRSAV